MLAGSIWLVQDSDIDPKAAVALGCSCCGRSYQRSKLHALGDSGAFICRRCGLYVALRLRHDPVPRADK